MTRSPLRGQVVWATIPGLDRKPYVVVSNNGRNRRLDDILVARITTSHKPDLPSIVPLGRQDPVQGRVCCDDVLPLYADEIDKVAAGLSRATMQRVDAALAVALGLDSG